MVRPIRSSPDQDVKNLKVFGTYAKRELVKHNLLEQTFVQHFQSSREIRTELSVGLLLIQGSDHP